MRILVFATDIPPIPGLPSSGTALRTYGFARGFLSHGCEVLICAPRGALMKQLRRTDLSTDVRAKLQSYLPLAFDSTNADELCSRHEPDAIFCGHWPAMCFSYRPSAPVIVDLPGPHLLERHFQGERDQEYALRRKLENLASADLFVVSGERQRNYFSAFMDRAGVEESAAKTFIVPMALDPELPIRPARQSGDARFLFAGVFLPWQDPASGLRTLVSELERRNHGQLKIVGGPHQSYKVPSGIYDQLFDELGRSSRVKRSELIPFEQLTGEMLSADVAFDLMKWNLERELAVTTRTTTYLWAGLPVIYNNFSDLGELITRYKAGWTIDPDDNAALLSVIEEIFSSSQEVNRRAANAQKLARNEFGWDRATKPILEKLNGGEVIRTAPEFQVEPLR